ncbi:lactate utilization protein [Actinophytocola gossypii]|uniref:LUD domain-containing protein n=1 Tax=Actinophytocola gossypii TaxID=2812003 RepID=A0ABT2JF22_9PSEU|nr:lactate utilization protein [Actinophytocola gossypii]MCT2586477.1 LUD domain-containing protein [Actinophytocola gossypii]
MTIEALSADLSFARPADDEQLARAVGGLTERGYNTHVVDTVARARELVRELLPRDKDVFTANSETLRTSGIADDVDRSGEFRSVRATLADESDLRAQIRMGAAPDVVVGSVQAITEDGVLVAASASGSQFGPYAAGAERVIWVVGAQKVVPDLDTALRRVRAYCYPLENERWRQRGAASFVGKLLIMEREAFPDRATVVLVREQIGY